MELKTVSIDAGSDDHSEFRTFSLAGAVAKSVDEISVGERLHVTKVVNSFGEDVGLPAFRVALGFVQKALGKKFATKKSNEGLCMIARIE